MSADEFYDFMVWHRGLAMPRARNLNDSAVQRGKKLFSELGCATCHRPSWKTGDDNYWAPALNGTKPLPRYRKVRSVEVLLSADAYDVTYHFRSMRPEAQQHGHVSEGLLRGIVVRYLKARELPVADESVGRKNAGYPDVPDIQLF